MFFAVSTTCSKGLFPRRVADAEVFAAFSPSESGTKRFLVSSREVDVREDAVVQNAEDMSYEFLSHIPLRCSEEDFGVLYQRPTHCWD